MNEIKVPERVTVTVSPQIDDAEWVYCEIDPDGPANKYVKGGVIKLPKPGQTYELTFQLEDGDIPGLEFDDPPFSSDSSKCPDQGDNDAQFSNPQVKPHTNARACTVEVTPNPAKNAVHYALHFTNGKSCDPIIINGKT